jgi:hypothetical protein
MKIKLGVSGGHVPVYKEAVIESAISEKELATLLSAIEIKGKSKAVARDTKSYTLEVNGKTVQIDPELVPEQFSDLFKELRSNLKNVSL